jgi:hypothetical protein
VANFTGGSADESYVGTADADQANGYDGADFAITFYPQGPTPLGAGDFFL